jgi:altronate dehydratase large subunit
MRGVLTITHFLDYERPDGQVGVRNYIGVIPSVFCANRVAKQIASQVKNTVSLCHPLGCSQVGADLEQTSRALIAMGCNPNLAAVLVVGLGCERFKPDELVEGIAKTGKPVQKVVIQNEGDTLKAVDKGVRLTRRLVADFAMQKREPVDCSRLIVGVKCGGTDATSGIAANPAVGSMANCIVDHNGTVIFSEVTELLGAEHILARRAVNKQVANEILHAIDRTENKLRIVGGDPKYKHRSSLISTGNFDGGVSTVVEKALGGIYKSGSRPINGVVDYACRPEGQGVYMMDSPGHDGEVVTGMVGGGAQIIVFTTGRGTPTGFPFVPVIKVTGNSETFAKMHENIDINAGVIIEGRSTIEDIGQQLFENVLAVASGKMSKAEILGHDELFCIARL